MSSFVPGKLTPTHDSGTVSRPENVDFRDPGMQHKGAGKLGSPMTKNGRKPRGRVMGKPARPKRKG